ncbi:MAG TPA: hypothetical protein PKD86_14375 [Gemmatales bacterium]|nr:hypothetical protein [Gemmatales bacterium]HMP60530.1 hypothetical protein [Gemmatales bacterium]
MSRPSLAEFKPKPKNDAYTVLLGLSLMAMIAACTLLFYDLKRYPSVIPPANLGSGGGGGAGGPGMQFTPPPGG